MSHPDFQMESAHLSAMLSLIEGEIVRLEEDVVEKEQQVHLAQAQSGGVYSSDLIVAQNLHAHQVQALHQHRLAKHTPYFTRVDFVPSKDGKKRTYYIGKWGVSHPQTMEPVIIDWRAPAANLYYAGQLGHVEYEAPDGAIHGELTLKRQLFVRKGVLESIFDTELAVQDAYLMSVLSEFRGQRLRDVVSTIQAQQNIIIRHTPTRALVVQGVAGSGKTTIALHRIAYLLYACRETLSPRHMLILAPNPLFLDYISSVLPDLGVEQVRQHTWTSFLSSLLGAHLPDRLEPSDSAERVLPSLPSREAMELARFFASLRFRSLLDEYLTFVERSMIPEGGVTFGPSVLYNDEQLKTIFLSDLSPFPLQRRLSELEKYLGQKCKGAQQQAAAWYENECQKRLDKLLLTLPDSPERRARVAKLCASRETRLDELKKKGKTFLRDEMSRWPRLDVKACYQNFFSDSWSPSLSSTERPVWKKLCEKKQRQFADDVYLEEDLGPLTVIVRKLFGLPREDIRHTVIDEAQDFSPFQFQLLREITGNDSFTIVGDLMQGIREGAGLERWEDMTETVFPGRADFLPLQVSYRSTAEIMEFASRILSRRPISGALYPQPVERHGEKPTLQRFENEKAKFDGLLSIISSLQAEGFSTIAVIGRDDVSCRKIEKALSGHMDIQYLRAGDTAYTGGVMVLPASLVKGLEFDCVLLSDADAQSFPEDNLHAKLLYVCLTRALHRLYCLSERSFSPLLQDESAKPAVFPSDRPS